MAERFDIWGPQVRNALGQFSSVPKKDMERAAAYGEKRAKGYAPVKTGNLKASIKGTTRGTGTGSSVGGAKMFISAPSKYAPVEFGSRRGHRAQRFLERGMFDALEWLEKEVLDDLEDLMIKGKVGHIGPRFSGRVR